MQYVAYMTSKAHHELTREMPSEWRYILYLLLKFHALFE